jgi:SAM-dependent methyltransferase
VRNACPVCSAAARYRFSVAEVPIFHCPSCQHSYADYNWEDQHVARVFGDEYFFEGGAGYRDYLREGGILRRQGARYGAILRRHVPVASRILDIGSAAGFVAAGIQDCGFSVVALEPNRRMAAHASDVLGLPVICTQIETMEGDTQYDVVTMIQLLAHLVDPHRALAVVARATRPGGYWLIEGWNSQSNMARIRGRRWHVYNPPSVIHYFSMQSLDTLAARFGFVRIGEGRPMKLITAGHAASLLEFLGTHSPLLRLAHGLVKHIPGEITLPYLGDDICWVLYKNKVTH